MTTISTSRRGFGQAGLGSKSYRKTLTPKGAQGVDQPVHPWRKITRSGLAYENKQDEDRRRALNKKWKDISAKRLADMQAKTRKRLLANPVYVQLMTPFPPLNLTRRR